MLPKWVLLALFFALQINCDQFVYTDLVDGQNNFTVRLFLYENIFFFFFLLLLLLLH